jgi:hypothetical protein
MLTVKQLLTTAGLDTPHDRIKLVRHSDHLGRSLRQIIADGCFEAYQSEQSHATQPFNGCDVILSFIGIENNLAEFHGAYGVGKHRPFARKDFEGLPSYLRIAHQDGMPRIWYELAELKQFNELRGRLITQWKSTRGWFQQKDLEVHEILPPVIAAPFPGYQDIVLKFEDLEAIFADPRAHRDWKAALKANAGIYRIVDLDSGQTYIGSAYGSEGLWGRWQTYAKTGHGGNKLLKDRDAKQFLWSVVRTLSTSMSERDVIRIEKKEKEKHGSKAIGLNAN